MNYKWMSLDADKAHPDDDGGCILYSCQHDQPVTEPNAYSAISSSLLSSTRTALLGGLGLLIIDNELYLAEIVCRRTLCLYRLREAQTPEASFLKPLHPLNVNHESCL